MQSVACNFDLAFTYEVGIFIPCKSENYWKHWKPRGWNARECCACASIFVDLKS